MSMIQDIEPRVFHNQFELFEPREFDTVLLFDGKSVLAQAGQRKEPEMQRDLAGTLEVHLPTLCEFLQLPWASDYQFVYLFRIDDDRYFMAMRIDPAPVARPVPPEGYRFVDVFEFRWRQHKDVGHAVATATQMTRWYAAGRYCGRCGHPTVLSTQERRLDCPACGNMIYPRISPAVIVAVTWDDKLLMTRYARRQYRERALIAGFCEVGETAEQTVAREVMEEAGVRVKNIRYYKSQPWGFDSNLLLGYWAELDGSPDIAMDDGELATAEWVARPDIFEEKDDISLTREMVMLFKNGKDAESR